MDEVEHAHDLVRRQAAQQRQADVAVTFEGAQHQGDDEHLLVVAHVAVVVVPRGQPDVEPRVQLDQVAMNRLDLVELAVRRRQQRVEDFQPQVLFVGRHDVTSVAAAAGRGPLRRLVRLVIFSFPWAASDGQCSAISRLPRIERFRKPNPYKSQKRLN